MVSFEIVITKADTTATITYTQADSNSRVLGRKLKWNENYPRFFSMILSNSSTTPAQNLLSSSYTGWSDGTPRMIDVGDLVKYSLYPTDSGSKTEVFYGAITKMNQSDDGKLNIEAEDFLKWFENQTVSRNIFGNYRDSIKHDTSYSAAAGCWQIEDVTDSGILQPLVLVQYAGGDEAIRMGVDQDSARNAKLIMVAQKFYPTQELLLGFSVIADDGNMNNVQYMICPADSSGDPDTANAIYDDSSGYIGGGASGYREWTRHFDAPLEVEIGKPYYFIVKSLEASYDQDIAIDDNPPNVVNEYLYESGGAWTTVAGKSVCVALGVATYEDIDPADYEVDESSDVINVYALPSGVLEATYWEETEWDLVSCNQRAQLHYYYGNTDLETVFDKILGLDAGVTGSTSTDLDRTIQLYRTRGKSLGACLRELADLFETGGTYSGRQHCVAHYQSGGLQYVKVGFRYKAADAACRILSDSTTTDTELRIIGIDLTKKIQNRASGVVIIGKDPNTGMPLVASRHDRGKATSFYDKCRFPVIDTISDESLTTLADVNKAAYAYLDSKNRDEWEGAITISGIFPDFIQLSTASAYYGSGRPITVSYARLGLSAQAFKVTGVVVYEDYTEVSVNNRDYLLENWLTETVYRSKKSEAFQSPDDLIGSMFFECYEDAVHNGTYYMQLCNASGTAIDGSERVLCTKFVSSDYTQNGYNIITYHAEFEMGNGYTTDGTDIITHIELYAAASGGAAVAQYVLTNAEQFAKWKTMRVILDYNVKAS